MDALQIINKREELFAAFSAVCQPRSDYQIQNFVVGEHVTPERQYMQVVVELQHKTSAIRRAVVNQKKLLRNLDNEQDELEKGLIQIELDDLALVIEGAVREFNTLHSIFKQYPSYTARELQEAEAGYWVKRLATQAQIDVESMGTIGAGNLDALRQAGMAGGFETRFLSRLVQSEQNPAPSMLGRAGKYLKMLLAPSKG
jgi:hypothetical protein